VVWVVVVSGSVWLVGVKFYPKPKLERDWFKSSEANILMTVNSL